MKQKVIAERERVIRSIYRNAEHALTELDDSTRDAGDLANACHDRDVLHRLQEYDAKHLQQIDDVLSRIERNEYGICTECENEIGAARLEAIPWARLCLQCQEQADASEPSPSYLPIQDIEAEGNSEAA